MSSRSSGVTNVLHTRAVISSEICLVCRLRHDELFEVLPVSGALEQLDQGRDRLAGLLRAGLQEVVELVAATEETLQREHRSRTSSPRAHHPACFARRGERLPRPHRDSHLLPHCPGCVGNVNLTPPGSGASPGGPLANPARTTYIGPIGEANSHNAGVTQW